MKLNIFWGWIICRINEIYGGYIGIGAKYIYIYISIFIKSIIIIITNYLI